MAVRTLATKVQIAAPLEEVFEFFSKAENLERITPRSLRFEILTPLPIEMRPGALIEYRLRLFGFPFRWLTEITEWEECRRFVDVQRKGPYKLWEHEHLFRSEGNTTVMEDNLRYEAPGGVFEPLVHSLFVHKRVEAIFTFREQAILSIFG